MKNDYRVVGDVVYLKLNDVREAIIDRVDMELTAPYRWSYGKTGANEYVMTRANGKTLYMHRLLLASELSDGLVPDHVNNEGLDNRRENLRVVSRRQNVQLGRRKDGASEYVGVKRSKKGWMSQILVGNGKKLTKFGPDPETLALWYDLQCVRLETENYKRTDGLGLNFPALLPEYLLYMAPGNPLEMAC